MAETTPLLYGPNGSPISSRTFLSAATNGSGSGPSWPIRALDPLRKLITYRDWLTTSFLSAKIFVNFGVMKGPICEKAMRAVGNAWRPLFMGEAKDWGQEARRWLLEEWYPSCNVRGRNYDFVTSLFIKSITCDRDGDCPTLLTKDDNGWPKFQQIPPRQIGQWNAAGGNQAGRVVVEDGRYAGAWIENGVIMNRQETPIAFRKLGDERGQFEDIPEQNIIHIFEPEWTDGTRGLPIFSASIEDFRRIATSDEWEQQSMLIASALGLVEFNERGGPDLTDPSTVLIQADDGTPTGLTTKTIWGGMVRYFRANSGSKLEQFVNHKPGDEWEKFQDRQIRKACAGANWPYELAWKRESLTGTSQRTILEQARGSVTDRQQLLMPVARRLVGYAISVAIKNGFLPPYPGRDKGGFLKWDFTLPPAISIDPGRDKDQAREDYKIGFETLQHVAEERGTTWEVIREQRQREVLDLIERAQSIAEETGIPFDTAMTLLQQQTSNANAPGGRFGSSLNEEPNPTDNQTTESP